MLGDEGARAQETGFLSVREQEDHIVFHALTVRDERARRFQ